MGVAQASFYLRIKMNKELKLLIVSLLGLTLLVAYIYWKQNYTCSTIEYQDLKGTHSKYECTKNKPKTCWDNWPTEQLAIEQCEGKQ